MYGLHQKWKRPCKQTLARTCASQRVEFYDALPCKVLAREPYIHAYLDYICLVVMREEKVEQSTSGGLQNKANESVTAYVIRCLRTKN